MAIVLLAPPSAFSEATAWSVAGKADPTGKGGTMAAAAMVALEPTGPGVDRRAAAGAVEADSPGSIGATAIPAAAGEEAAVGVAGEISAGGVPGVGVVVPSWSERLVEGAATS